MKNLLGLFLIVMFVLWGCKPDDKQPTPSGTTNTSNARMVFKFKFDSTQVRLNNIGQPAALPSGHSAQSPVFNGMSAHYIELSPEPYTPLGQGAVLYHAPETTLGGSTAINFDSARISANMAEFFSIPIKSVPAGTYKYLRISLSYQNYQILLKYQANLITGTIASFVGFNTYIHNHKIKDSTLTVNANRAQGYWAFETPWLVTSGQAPPGATTVPNPIFATSPIPQGSCVVTAAFNPPLVITGNETQDVKVIASLSTNKSFEWKDANMDGYYEPLAGDTVVDMGLRGLVPIIE